MHHSTKVTDYAILCYCNISAVINFHQMDVLKMFVRCDRKIQATTTSSEDLKCVCCWFTCNIKVSIVGIFGRLLMRLVRVFVLVALNISRRVCYIFTTRYAFTFPCLVKALLMGTSIFADIGQSIDRRRCLSSSL